MVDAEFVRCGEADVLRTVHRMQYEPGSELLMGHVMAQLPAGLFEVRVLARNNGPTGLRECARMLADPAAIPISPDAPVAISQSEYDDPRHDGAFPDHPLSRVREAQRWVTQHMLVDERATVDSSPRRIQSAVRGYAFTLPPRFIEGAAGIHRLSFCGTDGVQWLFVERLRRAADVEAAARKHARSKHREPGVQRVELDVSRSPASDARQAIYVRALAETREHAFGNAFAYFEAAGALWSVGLTNTRGIPADETLRDLSTVVTTFEAAERTSRRWWPFG